MSTRSSASTRGGDTTSERQHTSTVGTEENSATRGEGLYKSSNERESTANTFVIVGITAALIVICAAVVGALFCYRRKR